MSSQGRRLVKNVRKPSRPATSRSLYCVNMIIDRGQYSFVSYIHYFTMHVDILHAYMYTVSWFLLIWAHFELCIFFYQHYLGEISDDCFVRNLYKSFFFTASLRVMIRDFNIFATVIVRDVMWIWWYGYSVVQRWINFGRNTIFRGQN